MTSFWWRCMCVYIALNREWKGEGFVIRTAEVWCSLSLSLSLSHATSATYVVDVMPWARAKCKQNKHLLLLLLRLLPLD